MKKAVTLVALTLTMSAALAGTAHAACNLEDAQLEEAILNKPEFRDPANRQMVLDLRQLRESAFILWSYARYEDCDRLLASIRELVSSPSMGELGDSDEDEADQQFAARDPIVQRGGATIGRRDDLDAKPLISINEMAPGLRADEIIGAEVRSSDDKIIGEVRNIVFGTLDRRDYAIVAAGGFFLPGKDSIVVPIPVLRVSAERESFYLPLTEAEVKAIPLMPDQDYLWLADEAWRTRNDELFRRN